MNAAAYPSKRSRGQRRRVARSVRTCRYHVFSVKARGACSDAVAARSSSNHSSSSSAVPHLIRAGLPILSSLQMLGKNQKDTFFSGQLEDVANRVKTGEPLSAAFDAQGGFPSCSPPPPRRRALRHAAGGPRALRQLPAHHSHLPQEAHDQPHLSIVCSYLSPRCHLHVCLRRAPVRPALRSARLKTS